MDDKYKDAETRKDNTSRVDHLKERVKELNCIYGITDLVHDTSKPFKEAMQSIVELIPLAWQHSDISEAKIIIDGLEFKTKDYKDTPWTQESKIKWDNKTVGTLRVAYLEEKPKMDEGPFLEGERRLIHAISDLLGKYMIDRGVKDSSLQELGRKKTLHENTDKAQWEVIIDLLMRTDPRMLLRITRKMVYYLYRNENKKITDLMQTVCPIERGPGIPQWCGINMPNPRQDMDTLKRIQKGVFEIARDTLSSEEISEQFQRWLREDKARPLLLASQRAGITLVDITDELNRFYENLGGEKSLAPEDSKAIRTSLLRRFFSERLEFINIAKKFITIDSFIPLLKRVIGPAQGAGKLGGKSSGLFLAKNIIQLELPVEEDTDWISFPKSWYLTSDTMMDLIQYNDLDEVLHLKYLEPEEIQQEMPILEHLFKSAVFSAEIIEGLRRILRDLEGRPIIVRSSSLLEDSFGAAFSGKYKSLFIANIGSEEERLSELMNAIGEVYASTLAPDPIEYRRERGLLDVNEEMGVLIQEVVGTRIGPYYLPAYAGVVFSRNEFQWSPRIRREDGIVRMVTGLGTRAVDRIGNDYPILISPRRPELRVNTTAEERVKYSQRYMDVINMEKGILETVDSIEVFRKYGEDYPCFKDVVSVYKDGGLSPISYLTNLKEEDLVVTFDKLFEKNDFVNRIRWIIDLLEDKLGIPVDVEFASDGEKLYVLQCRPQSQSKEIVRKPVPTDTSEEHKIFSANKYVTTGYIDNIEYVVYVDLQGYEALERREDMYKVAKVVSELNSKLPNRRFILMGPGRWGSRGDIKLGVPVVYRDINNTSLLVEIAREKGGYVPELSFGTHFFQDLVEADIKYLPLYPDNSETLFNERFLKKSPNHLSDILPNREEMEGIVRVIKISKLYKDCTMSVVMDGEKNEALGYIKPADHWEWRSDKLEEIAQDLDAELYGVKAFYVLGSTKDGTAGPGSDIDIIIHFDGDEVQRDKLLSWFKKREKEIMDVSSERAKKISGDLFDIHIITDKDIEKRTSWAAHIDSPYGSAREIPLD